MDCTAVLGILSRPTNVRLTSDNMNLVLRWSPPEGASRNLLYTAEYKWVLHSDELSVLLLLFDFYGRQSNLFSFAGDFFFCFSEVFFPQSNLFFCFFEEYFSVFPRNLFSLSVFQNNILQFFRLIWSVFLSNFFLSTKFNHCGQVSLHFVVGLDSWYVVSSCAEEHVRTNFKIKVP